MVKIKDIGRAECKFLSRELEAVIQQTVNKYGLTASYATGRYGGHTATFSFKLDVPERAEKAANNHALALGAKFEVGYTFTQNGERFKVTGFNTRRRKYPVSAEDVRNGKEYKFTVAAINRNIEIAELFEKSRAKDKVTA
jgi:hypothetical protein